MMIQSSQQKIVSIATPDGKRIYALHDLAGDTPSDRLLILSHGLAGGPEDFIHVTAQHYFNEQGYDVLRPYFYSRHADARKLLDCTFSTHARDLGGLAHVYRQKYRHIFVAGHSSGGLVALMANPAVSAISLWDPAFIKIFFVPHAVYRPEINAYTVGRGIEYLINPSMYDEASSMDEEKSLAFARAITTPTQIISSGDDHDLPHLKILYDALQVPKDRQIVPGADHLFTRGNTAQILLQQAAEWYDRHVQEG